MVQSEPSQLNTSRARKILGGVIMRIEIGVNKVYVQAEITDYASRGARRSLPNRLKIVRRDLAEINNSIRFVEDQTF